MLNISSWRGQVRTGVPKAGLSSDSARHWAFICVWQDFDSIGVCEFQPFVFTHTYTQTHTCLCKWFYCVIFKITAIELYIPFEVNKQNIKTTIFFNLKRGQFQFLMSNQELIFHIKY